VYGAKEDKTAQGLRTLEMGNGSTKWGGRFTKLHLEGQIPRRQTYPLGTIAGSWRTVVVCLSAIPGGGLENNGQSSFPGTPTAVDQHLGRGYVELFLLLLLREEQGLITHRALKGREAQWPSREGCSRAYSTHTSCLLQVVGLAGNKDTEESSPGPDWPAPTGRWIEDETQRTGWPTTQ
jgi:hypothetical protein